MITPGLLSELKRIDALFVQAAQRLYRERQGSLDEFRGLYISDQEFLNLLDRPFAAPFPVSLPLNQARASFEAQNGQEPWHRLVATLSLSPFEQDVLLLCLLAEIDLKYDRLFAFLQDDITAKRPSVDLLLNLFCPELPQRLQARVYFMESAPLVRYRLVDLHPPNEGPDALLRRMVQASPTVVQFLLNPSTTLPFHPLPYWRLISNSLERRIYPARYRLLVEDLIEARPSPTWVVVRSERPWPAKALAQDLASSWGVPLAEMTVNAASSCEESTQKLRRNLCYALLYGAVLLIHLPDRLHALPEDSLPVDIDWGKELQDAALTIVWHVPSGDVPPALPPDGVRLFHLDWPGPDVEARHCLWEHALAGAPLSPDVDLVAVANRYRLDGDQIAMAGKMAREFAAQRQASNMTISLEDLTAAARAVSIARLGGLAQRITPHYRWEDLVLPEDRVAQLVELCDRFRYQHRVLDTWGLGSKSSRGRGLSALFAGPSGTGKTMAAEVIANELALDLYKIDLSGVVSKYVGETEKNLDRIFDLARDSNAILLFDEADALFGKRSETKDAHDRYANIEVSYLLQKIEEYDGIVILTSNLRQNLDEAFLRRLQYSVDFPFPDREARLLIWQRSIPAEMPIAADIPWEALAERFRIAGGSIHNALVTAAFLAAREGEVVALPHLLKGIRREFQKLGKLVDEQEFAMETWVGVTKSV